MKKIEKDSDIWHIAIFHSIKLPFYAEVAEKFLNVIYWVFSSIGLTADVRFGTSSHNLIIKVLRQ